MDKFSSIVLVFIMLSLLIVPSAIAAPPFITEPVSSEVGGLDIAYPPIIYYLEDSNLTLNFHVYNSTGFIMNNSDVSCIIDIYNQNGIEIIEDNLTYESDDFYYVFNYTSLDCCINYQWIVYCNGTEAGYITGGFVVNTIGKDFDNSNNNSIYILFLLMAGLLISSFGMLLYSKNKYLKLVYANSASLLLMFTTMFVSWFIRLSYPIATTLNNSVTRLYSFTTIIMWITIIISLILLVVFTVIDSFNKKKAKENKLWDQYSQ